MVRNQQYSIVGTSEQSHLLFNYVEPTVTRVTPRRGFRSGSTSVTLVGKHLDVGSNLSVSIAGTACQLQGCVHSIVPACREHAIKLFFRIRLENEMHCVLSPNLSLSIEAADRRRAADRALLTGDVIVRVDNAQLASAETFSFFDEAVVAKVEGARSIARSKHIYSSQSLFSDPDVCLSCLFLTLLVADFMSRFMARIWMLPEIRSWLFTQTTLAS